MSQEQQYRPLKAGEIISNGDQYLDVCGNWIGYVARRCGQEFTGIDIARRLVVEQQVEYRSIEAGEIIQDGDQFLYDGEWVAYQPHRWGSPFNCVTQARRPIVKNGQGEAGEAVVEPEQPADRTTPTLTERLQDSLVDTLRCNGVLHQRIAAITKERDDAITLHAFAKSDCERLQASLDEALRCNAELHRAIGEDNEQIAAITKERDVMKEAYDNCLVQSNLIVQDGQKAKAELAASQRMYMEAMTALQREINQHRENNRRLWEVCGRGRPNWQ